MTGPEDTENGCTVDGCTGSHVVYIVGHNMPGYLPVSAPWTYDTFDAAKSDMIDTLDRDADSLDDVARVCDDPDDAARFHDEAETLSADMQDLNLDHGPEWSTTVGNVAYWITCDTLTCEEYAEIMTYQDGGGS